jgi:hypothetical protein
VLALLVGPLALIAFSLTADLTPVYFDLVGRAQTFVHPAVMILAALAAVSVAERGRRRHIRSGKDDDAYSTTGGSRPTLRTVIVPLVLVCALVSAPLAFAGLHAFAYQSTTTPAEFETANFAATHLAGSWASDGHLTRIASNYYLSGTGGSTEPIYRWLRSGGGGPPGCPIVTQESWMTTGAQLMPAAPGQLGNDRYRELLTDRSVVYAAGTEDPLRVVVSNFRTIRRLAVDRGSLTSKQIVILLGRGY